MYVTATSTHPAVSTVGGHVKQTGVNGEKDNRADLSVPPLLYGTTNQPYYLHSYNLKGP